MLGQPCSNTEDKQCYCVVGSWRGRGIPAQQGAWFTGTVQGLQGASVNDAAECWPEIML